MPNFYDEYAGMGGSYEVQPDGTRKPVASLPEAKPEPVVTPEAEAPAPTASATKPTTTSKV